MQKYVKKILVLRHPLGDLGVTHMVQLWLDGKRVFNIFASSHSRRTMKRIC